MQNLNLSSCASATWSKIEGFDHYLISRDGVIISFYTLKNGEQQLRKLQPKMLQNGYVMVCLKETVNGKTNIKVCQLGRLVLSTFNPLTKELEESDTWDCDHIDNDPMNNALSNLLWLTHRDNILRRRSNNLNGVKRDRPVIIFWQKGGYTIYSNRKDAYLTIGCHDSTLSHLLFPSGKMTIKNYSGSSKKYGIKSAFYFDENSEIPEEYSKLIKEEDLLHFD